MSTEETPPVPAEDAVPAQSTEGGLVASPGTPHAETAAHAKANRQLLTGRTARLAAQFNSAPRTPSQLAWRELKKNSFAVTGLWLLILLYVTALFAPFVAPYDAQDQLPGKLPSASFHPPMRLRFREANGTWHLRPFVYGTIQQFTPLRDIIYPMDPAAIHPVSFFVKGAPYKLFGLIPTSTHLFGVAEGGRICLLGTDEYGRDYLSRLLAGAQVSLSVGLIAIAITFTIGMLVGGIAGYYGGVVDEVIMRFCEVLMSVPDFYLLLALAAALPATLSPVAVYILIIVILSFIGWAGMARVVRGMVLSVREREYVEAGRSMGLGDLKLITRHILPSTFTYAIVSATMSVPGYILAEAGLSFLGLGIRDPMASWGNMLSAAQNLATLTSRPWILAPGVTIFITTLAFNFLGDGLRDALDPKSRRLG
jgi:peptide/nickel transport system permease protein